MGIVKDWWTAAGYWDRLTDEQKKSIVVWLEGYLGKDFAKQLGIARGIGKRLSSYKDFSNRIDVSEMNELVEVLACYDPIEFHTFYVVKADCAKRAYIGMDGANYPTQEARDEADRKLTEILRELDLGGCHEDGVKKLRKKRDKEEMGRSGFEYHVNFLTSDGNEHTMDILDTAEDAIEKAKYHTVLRLKGLVRMDMDEVCDEDKLDWTKRNVIEIPKAKLIESRLDDEFSILCKTVKDSPFAEKILDTAQNDEFIDFLKTI